MTQAESLQSLPFMPAVCADYLRERLKSCRSFLEYGAGGSTMLALTLQVPQIQSIESDQRWLESIQQSKSKLAHPYQGHHIGTHIDIGPVGDWGYPTETSHHTSYWRYPTTPWRNSAGNASPDLVLIDGRFRVACLVMTMLHADAHTTILFDDYVDRAHYHVVERHFRPKELVDRMAVFRVEENISTNWDVLDLLLPALQDPR